MTSKVCSLSALVFFAAQGLSASLWAESPTWQNYLQGYAKSPNTLQSACPPRKVEHTAKTHYRGSVILFHGFTACPSQYNEMATHFAEQGYDSYLMLLPGHGLSDESGRFVPDALPKANQWKLYLEMAQTANQISKELPGEKLVGGLSVGGAVALASVVLEPTLYSRAMLFAPYLHSATPSSQYGMVVARVLPPLANKKISWGKSCTDDPHRIGYCDFRVTHLIAAENLGRWIESEGPKIQNPRTRIQLIQVDKDDAVDNRKTLVALKRTPLNWSACRLEHLDHPFFVRKASNLKSQELEVFFPKMSRFVGEGPFWESLPETGVDSRIAPLCRLE